ncbi:MAG TPA: UvrD-helicase domain-containing protein [Bellilinea sp.]|nr:UvrD-helicase domain-containing protein [Bellilinea sp.]
MNSPQLQAVTAGTGQVLVLAGPGSGKTRVLTQRIAYLIQHMGVRPQNILSVTFTNKAAREMEHRLEALLPGQVQGIWLGTFHANCARILRRETDHLPFDRNFVIMDADDQLSIVRRAIKELNLDDKTFRPTGIHAAISKAKNNLVTADDFPTNNYREEVTRRVYERYQQLLRASNAVDFDDLMLETVKLLVDNPLIREQYARRFEHVLVDEFQDTNVVQYELLKLLSSAHRNIFVVGDEDQSIYRWRGADYRNVLRFEEDYPETKKILLEQNYRSTQTVLNAAQGVINRNKFRTIKRLFSDRGSGETLTLYEAEDDKAEAEYVVETIRGAMERSRTPAGNFAVMYRTNAQSRLLEEAFLRTGLPYRLVGAQRFYGRREVKDVIAYLRLVHNPRDEVSLERVINVPPRGVGNKTLSALKQAAQAAGRAPGELLMALSYTDGKSLAGQLTGRSEQVLAPFGRMLSRWTAEFEGDQPLPVLFDRILADTAYQDYIEDGSEEGAERWENIQELRRLAYEYSDRGLTAFLENLALVSDQDTLPEEAAANAPTLLTLHAAKGLEFPQVFIVGLDDGLLPHSRSKEDPEEMAEERRLLYVGITRAKDRVYLVRANRRSTFGGYDDQDPSPFLQDIPEELIKRSGQRRSAWDSSFFQSSRPKTWNVGTTGIRSAAANSSAPIIEQRYHPADHVRHPIFGEGIVLDSRIQDDDETVDVHFESVGFKRVAASLAKLELLPKGK